MENGSSPREGIREFGDAFKGAQKRKATDLLQKVYSLRDQIRQRETEIEECKEALAPLQEKLAGIMDYSEVKSFHYGSATFTSYPETERWTVAKEMLLANGVAPEVIKKSSRCTKVAAGIRVSWDKEGGK